MTSTYICPVCGCHIHVQDTYVRHSETYFPESQNFVITQQIQHQGNFLNENCVNFFNMFLEEQNAAIKQTMNRLTSTFSGKANLLD